MELANHEGNTMNKDFYALKRFFNAFEPFQPLQAGDPLYVDCRNVRGDSDIEEELGREILYSNSGISCQLYAGHRGGGKSTELLRLKQYLERHGCFVVYFDATDQDIDIQDAQYTDVLLACTRHILENLKNANPKPLLNWLQERWEDLKDLASTKIILEDTSIEIQMQQFAKLTANLRAVPSLRHKIRQKVEPYTTTLLKALNDFINDAKQNLPAGYSELAVIADSLDRIVPVIQEDGRSNHEHIFIDRCEQLKALDCHIIYTVPISLLYSNRAGDLRHNYGDDEVLPMIQVRTRQGEIHQQGLNKMREVVDRRFQFVNRNYPIKGYLFQNSEILDEICLMSGGHIRELLLIIRAAIRRSNSLPISAQATQRAIIEARYTYRRTIEAEQWSALAKVARTKRIINDNLHRSLLFNRCILEYYDPNQAKYNSNKKSNSRWYDVHPLIRDIDEFKLALSKG